MPNSTKIKGDIVSIERNSSGRSIFRPTIRYVVEGKEYYIAAGHSGSSYRVGQTMTVHYNKKNPEDAIVRPPISTYVVLGIVLLIGVYVALATFFPELGLDSTISF